MITIYIQLAASPRAAILMKIVGWGYTFWGVCAFVSFLLWSFVKILKGGSTFIPQLLRVSMCKSEAKVLVNIGMLSTLRVHPPTYKL
jgi:hypothetical protein